MSAERFDEGAHLVTLTVGDGDGNEASGRLLLNVHPADGSYGLPSPEVRIAVVPNAVQPDFLDLFLLSELDVSRHPRLRIHAADEWAELAVTETAPGIWHAAHALRPGMMGNVEFLGLTASQDRQILKAEAAIAVGTVIPASPKRVGGPAASANFEAGAFDRETVVALIPGAHESGQRELTELSTPLTVHATSHFRGEAAIAFELDGVETSGTAAVYRWSALSGRWDYVGGHATTGGITSAIRDWVATPCSTMSLRLRSGLWIWIGTSSCSPSAMAVVASPSRALRSMGSPSTPVLSDCITSGYPWTCRRCLWAAGA